MKALKKFSLKSILLKLNIILFCGVLFFGCTIQDDQLDPYSFLPPLYTPGINEMLFLQIDFMTKVFERGGSHILPHHITKTDSLEIGVLYLPDNDIKVCITLTLFYKPSRGVIFHDTINGKIGSTGNGLPIYRESSHCERLSTKIDMPDITDFQVIFNEKNVTIDYEAIWSAINDLEVLPKYLESNKKIGLFLYTPNVDNQSEWKWYIIMNHGEKRFNNNDHGSPY